MFNATLKPAQIEIVAMPGASLTQAYDVTNNSDSPLVISTSVLPWQASGTNGSITYDNIPSNQNFEFSLANADLRLGQSLVLRPHENRQLVLKIKSLATAPPQDAYFTFFINQDPSGQLNSDTSGGQATARIGSHLLVSTSSTENPAISFAPATFNSSTRLADVFFPTINFTGTIANKTAYFTKITGKLTISKSDKTVAEIPLFPDNVLAYSSRDFRCLLEDKPISCSLHPPYWPGVYHATISTDSGPSLSTTFIVFPFSILAFILLIGGFVYQLVKKKK
jgi:hypothetical protein